MHVRSIYKLLIISVFVSGVLSARADFESASEAYRNNDYIAAFEEFLPLAKNGDPRAQTIIAMMYKYGESVEQDFEQAFKWYVVAAEQGYPSAQFSLAGLYESGKGVDPDPEKASYWLKLSAQQGLRRAKQQAPDIEYLSTFDPASLYDSQGWSRAWNFELPEENQADKDASDSVDPSNDSGSFWVQLGAMRSSASANRLWNITSEPNQDLFQGLEPRIKSRSTETGRLFRLQTGPFSSLEQAQYFCDGLSSRGIETGCLAIKSIEPKD